MGLGQIVFSNTSPSNEVVGEEFFHGFQNLFYIQTGKFENMSRDYGGSNTEFEPKFFMTLADAFLGDENSSYEGMFRGGLGPSNFSTSLYLEIMENFNEYGESLTGEQKEIYMQALQEFSDLYKQRNKEVGADNLYDDTPTDNTPDAALHLINSVNEDEEKD